MSNETPIDLELPTDDESGPIPDIMDTLEADTEAQTNPPPPSEPDPETIFTDPEFQTDDYLLETTPLKDITQDPDGNYIVPPSELSKLVRMIAFENIVKPLMTSDKLLNKAIKTDLLGISMPQIQNSISNFGEEISIIRNTMSELIDERRTQFWFKDKGALFVLLCFVGFMASAGAYLITTIPHIAAISAILYTLGTTFLLICVFILGTLLTIHIASLIHLGITSSIRQIHTIQALPDPADTESVPNPKPHPIKKRPKIHPKKEES